MCLKLGLVSLKSDSLFPRLHFTVPAQTYISSCTAFERVSKDLTSNYSISDLCPLISLSKSEAGGNKVKESKKAFCKTEHLT